MAEKKTGIVLMDKREAQRIHEAAQALGDPAPRDWENARKKYADDDNSIDARMWRLHRDHVEMGSRT